MNRRSDPRPTRLTGGDPPGGELSALLGRAVEATREAPLGARERIWRSLEAPHKRAAPRKWAPALIPGFGFALAAIAVFALRPPPAPPLAPVSSAPVATVVLATRNAWVDRPDGTGGAPAPGELLSPGARLHTGGEDRAGLRLEGAGVLIAGGSGATLHAAVPPEARRFPGEGGELSLSAGRVVLCAQRPSLDPLSVAAESFLVEGSRADFEVQVAADRTVTVLVHDGSVQVRGPSGDATVGAGESWSSLDGPGHETGSEAELATARWLRAAPGAETPLRLDASSGSTVELDGVTLGPAPLRVMAPLGPHTFAAVREGRRAEVLALVGAGTGALTLPEPGAVPSPGPAPLDAPASADAEVGALQAKLSGQLSAAEREAVSYELARLLAGRGRATEAVALFDALSRGEGARAEAALYEAGRLRLRNLGDPGGALEAFTRYRRRFANGALVQEVALSTIEAHLARSEQDEALRELDSFMVDYPDSERRDDLRFIRGNLRRERGECQAAAGDYLLLLDDAKRGEDALFFAAGCERKNGDLEGARRHLRAYLERYPAGVHRAEAERALGGQ